MESYKSKRLFFLLAILALKGKRDVSVSVYHLLLQVLFIKGT